MKGTIRFFLGMLMAFGAVGGLDTSSNLLVSFLLAMAGLAIMYSGTLALTRNS